MPVVGWGGGKERKIHESIKVSHGKLCSIPSQRRGSGTRIDIERFASKINHAISELAPSMGSTRQRGEGAVFSLKGWPEKRSSRAGDRPDAGKNSPQQLGTVDIEAELAYKSALDATGARLMPEQFVKDTDFPNRPRTMRATVVGDDIALERCSCGDGGNEVWQAVQAKALAKWAV
ncbi:MAG: hypothetical protein Q9169_002446 [Polycauliona sp. 2 TL-2023]